MRRALQRVSMAQQSRAKSEVGWNKNLATCEARQSVTHAPARPWGDLRHI